jgi:hypothetical protein
MLRQQHAQQDKIEQPARPRVPRREVGAPSHNVGETVTRGKTIIARQPTRRLKIKLRRENDVGVGAGEVHRLVAVVPPNAIGRLVVGAQNLEHDPTAAPYI